MTGLSTWESSFHCSLWSTQSMIPMLCMYVMFFHVLLAMDLHLLTVHTLYCLNHSTVYPCIRDEHQFISLERSLCSFLMLSPGHVLIVSKHKEKRVIECYDGVYSKYVKFWKGRLTTRLHLSADMTSSLCSSLCFLIGIRRQTVTTDTHAHMYKCTTLTEHTRTHTSVSNWVTQSHWYHLLWCETTISPRATGGLCSHTASKEGWRSEGRRKGKEKTNRRQTGPRRWKMQKKRRNTTKTETQSGAEFIN